MTVPLRAFFVAGVAGVVACSSNPPSTEKTGTSGVADPATGCVLVGDASTDGFPPQSELPSGACADSAKACESLVEVACGSCGMTSLGLWDCACVGGTWSCTLGGTPTACPACPSDAGDDDAGD